MATVVVSQLVMVVHAEATTGGSSKKGFLKDCVKFTRKHLCQSIFLIKLQVSAVYFTKKKCRCFPWFQILSCEFCQFFKNALFTEQLRATASVKNQIWSFLNFFAQQTVYIASASLSITFLGIHLYCVNLPTFAFTPFLSYYCMLPVSKFRGLFWYIFYIIGFK